MEKIATHADHAVLGTFVTCIRYGELKQNVNLP